MRNTISRIAVVLFLSQGHDVLGDIPDWYADAVPRLAANANSIVLYRTEAISLVSRQGHHYVYRLSTTTVEVLKGTASAHSCYLIVSEGLREYKDHVGEIRLAVLTEPENENCRLIDVGHGAPGSDEYVQLFEEELARQSIGDE